MFSLPTCIQELLIRVCITRSNEWWIVGCIHFARKWRTSSHIVRM